MFDAVHWPLLYAIAAGAIVAGLMTRILVIPASRIAEILGAIDQPGERRKHARPTPSLGGIALAVGIVLGVGSGLLVAREMQSLVLALRELLALFLAASLLFITGLVDDFSGLSWWRKLQIQIAAAAIVVVVLRWTFEKVSLPGGGQIYLGPVFGSLVAIAWIVAVVNAINLIDGMDGLAAGVTTIIAASLGVFAFAANDAVAAIICASLVGAGMAFLPHNREPARIFMGDSGSLTLGFLLAAASVHGSLKAPTAVAILAPLLALGVPVIDALLVMLVRFLERPKSPVATRILRVFKADRNHLHHRIEQFAPNRRSVVRTIYGLVVACCLLAFVVGFTRNAVLGGLVLVVEILAVVAVRSSLVGKRPWAQRLLGSVVEADGHEGDG